MGEANGLTQNNSGNINNSEEQIKQIFEDFLKDMGRESYLIESRKTPEEKLADREKELSELKNTCRGIKSDLQDLMIDVKNFASIYENDFDKTMVIKAKNNLDEATKDCNVKFPKFQRILMERIYRYEIVNLLSEQLNEVNLTWGN